MWSTKKREVLLHLSREKNFEFEERIYNQHIGSFSPEPFGWLAPPSLLGAREPTLSWNQLQCAGLNRLEAEDERALRERSSDPLGPEFCAGRCEVSSEA